MNPDRKSTIVARILSSLNFPTDRVRELIEPSKAEILLASIF